MSFTCPRCGRVSQHPTDAAEGYCGACHAWTGPACPPASPGDRVRLVSTTDPHTRLRPDALGTVAHVDDLGTVHVRWDDGGFLGLVPDEDSWEVL